MHIQTVTSQDRDDAAAWSQHWSSANQASVAQRFFSIYRRVVFSRTVKYFIEKYFPASGIFLEAGSGTAETSMRIDKRSGNRRLVALDIVLPVVRQCHPIMDDRICGDIFQLPFPTNSFDGIWNVGVMEHFDHDQIDEILQEFYRVLRPAGRLILLWPGVDSVPQRLLRLVEKLINFRKGSATFHFHPAEISQLKSVDEGFQVLVRNHFRVLEVEDGPRSLFAFKIVVGQKC